MDQMNLCEAMVAFEWVLFGCYTLMGVDHAETIDSVLIWLWSSVVNRNATGHSLCSSAPCVVTKSEGR
jgi:hypothetical membrane protein